MKEYITVIVGAALLSVLADILSPEQWRKYIKIVTGFVIISVIISPVARLKNIDLFEGIDYNNTASADFTDYRSKWVAEEFEIRVENDIKERVMNDYGKKCDVDVGISINEDNMIEAVERIEIYTYGECKGLKEKMAYMYGVDANEVKVNE